MNLSWFLSVLKLEIRELSIMDYALYQEHVTHTQIPVIQLLNINTMYLLWKEDQYYNI